MCFFKLEFKPGVGGGFLRAFTSQKGPGGPPRVRIRPGGGDDAALDAAMRTLSSSLTA